MIAIVAGAMLLLSNALRLGVHRMQLRQTLDNQLLYGELEDRIAAHEAALANVEDKRMSGRNLTQFERQRIADERRLTFREKQAALLALGDHSSKAETERLDRLYADVREDDLGLAEAIGLLFVGIAVSPFLRFGKRLGDTPAAIALGDSSTA